MTVKRVRREGRYCPTGPEDGQTQRKRPRATTYTFLRHLPSRRASRRLAAHNPRITFLANAPPIPTLGLRQRKGCTRRL
jgi:hypothetical protein